MSGEKSDFPLYFSCIEIMDTWKYTTAKIFPLFVKDLFVSSESLE